MTARIKADKLDQQALTALVDKRGLVWVLQQLTGAVARLEQTLAEERGLYDEE